VRTAARDALESLAVRATETLRAFLVEAHASPAAHEPYGQIGREVFQLGAKLTPTDLASALHHLPTDAQRADVLAALPLWLRDARARPPLERVAIQRLLVHLARDGGERAREMARACLVLEATHALRAATDGAPRPAPARTREAEDWLALLSVKDTTWISESAGVVLCACGRPGSELLDHLGSMGWLHELAVHGRAAESAAGRVASQVPPSGRWVGWPANRACTLWRLGRRDDLLPAPPQASEGDEARDYAIACAGLAVADPASVRTAVPWLIEHASARQDGVVAMWAVLALSRMGSLPPEAVSRLVELGEEPASPRGAALMRLARLALARTAKVGNETLRALLAELPADEEPGGFRDETVRAEVTAVLPQMTSILDPVRRELEALLANGRVPLDLRVALLGVYGRMPSADAGTVDLLRSWLKANSPRDQKSGAGAEPIEEQLKLGHQATYEVAGQMAAVESLRAMGKRAGAAIPELEALLPAKSPVLEWRVRRALHALR
jgi:hypothetical protein